MNDPTQPHVLVDTYPRPIVDEFGLDSIEGAFFVKNKNDNYILFFKGKVF